MTNTNTVVMFECRDMSYVTNSEELRKYICYSVFIYIILNYIQGIDCLLFNNTHEVKVTEVRLPMIMCYFNRDVEPGTI